MYLFYRNSKSFGLTFHWSSMGGQLEMPLVLSVV